MTTTREIPAKPKAEPKPDLTLLRDPAALWPDPEDCPDPGENYTREWTEVQLQRASAILNGPGPLRAPTDDERGGAEEWLERRDPGGRKRFMVERARHLRGHLRKLDAQAEAREKHAEQRKEQRAAKVGAQFEEHLERLYVEKDDLIAGAERYRQHLADKEAYGRVRFMRDEISQAHSAAVSAAREAGVEAPALPGWVEEIPDGF